MASRSPPSFWARALHRSRFSSSSARVIVSSKSPGRIRQRSPSKRSTPYTTTTRCVSPLRDDRPRDATDEPACVILSDAQTGWRLTIARGDAIRVVRRDDDKPRGRCVGRLHRGRDTRRGYCTHLRAIAGELLARRGGTDMRRLCLRPERSAPLRPASRHVSVARAWPRQIR
jgi:hypothetical protein